MWRKKGKILMLHFLNHSFPLHGLPCSYSVPDLWLLLLVSNEEAGK